MKNKKIVLASLLSVFATMCLGCTWAQPAWSVTPSNYDNSMVITAVLQIGGEESRDANDMVAAFVNGEVRGVAKPDTYLAGQDRYMAQLIVYSNDANESITFKLYDNSANTEIDAVTLPITFIADGVIGGFDAPQIITDNNMPTDIALSNSNVLENQGTGTTVGTFSTTDADADTFTYSLVSGDGDTDNASFTISGNELKTAAILNYELKATHAIRVRTTDSKGGSLEEIFTISLLDGNDPPTDITISNDDFAENLPAGNLVGNLSTVDEDATDTYTYSLTSGDIAYFTIDGDQLLNKQTFNFESKSSYAVTIKTTDASGAEFEKIFAVNIINANDAPTDMALNPAEVAENEGTGASVGLLSTTDEDTGDEFVYTLVSGDKKNDNDHFIVINNEIKTLTTFDYEQRQLYYINVQVTDGGRATYTELFAVQINDANDAPTAIELSDTEIAENSNVGDEVATLFTIDPDTINSHTYELVTGTGSTDNDKFTIAGDKLLVNAAFDYEGTQLFKVRIKTTDNGTPAKSLEQAFVIQVTDENDVPQNLQLSFDQVAENAPVGTVIGSFSVSDQDVEDEHQYTLIAGSGSDDNAAFAIVYGELRNLVTFDYETKSVYTIRVRATDVAGAVTEEQFAIFITDNNDVPTLLKLDNHRISEASPINTVVGTLSTIDPDGGNTFTYALTGSGNDNANFVIIGDELLTNTAFDYEHKVLYFIHVTSSDNEGGKIEEQLTIIIEDANDAPTDVSLSNQKVAERLDPGTLVGLLSTTDRDNGDIFTYKLVEGEKSEGNDAFQIAGNQLLSTKTFDFEATSSYSIRISTTDSIGAVLEKNFIISVIDANDEPVSINLSNNKLEENKPMGSFIGALDTEDEDTGEQHTYSFISGEGGADNAKFSINGNQLVSNAIFDYETQQLYNILIESKDNEGATVTSPFVIEVFDKHEHPVLEDTTFRVEEESAVDALVGTLLAQDQNPNTIFTYNIIYENDEDELEEPFDIDEQRGDLLVNNPKLLDYEVNNVFFVKVRVTNSANLADTAKVTIRLTDIIEVAELPANNYISPNGDRKNDVWEIQNVELYSGFELIVFNDNGEVVYRATDYQNNWGGEYNGQLLPSGVYYYSFKNDIKGVAYKGSITLVR